MKKIILLALCFIATKNLKAQTLHNDATLRGLTYVNALYTDTANEFTNIPLKMHVDVSQDKGDTVNGAMFSFYFYSKKGRIISNDAIPITGTSYNVWDANDPKAVYNYTRSVLATQGIWIDFQP